MINDPKAEHRDPVLEACIRLIELDIAAGRNVRGLPAELAAALRRAMSWS